DAADSLGLLLNHCGYDVQVAYTGVEALKIAAYHHPQIVFAELVLPDVDTALFAARLRRQAMLVAVTVLDDAKYRQWAMAHGFGHHRKADHGKGAARAPGRIDAASCGTQLTQGRVGVRRGEWAAGSVDYRRSKLRFTFSRCITCTST